MAHCEGQIYFVLFFFDLLSCFFSFGIFYKMNICGRTEHSILYKIEQRRESKTPFLFFSAIDTISNRKWEETIPSLKIIDGLILSPSDLFSLFLNKDNDEGIEILFPTTPKKGDKLIITLLVSLPLQDKLKGIMSLEELEVSYFDRHEMMMKDLRSNFETFEATTKIYKNNINSFKMATICYKKDMNTSERTSLVSLPAF